MLEIGSAGVKNEPSAFADARSASFTKNTCPCPPATSMAGNRMLELV